VKRDAFTVGAGVANEVRTNLSLFADYNLELRGGGQKVHLLAAGLRLVW